MVAEIHLPAGESLLLAWPLLHLGLTEDRETKQTYLPPSPHAHT